MIRPLRSWLAIRPAPQVARTATGLHLLPHVDEGLVKEVVAGEVVAVGDGPADGSGMWGLQPGDQVAYSPVNSQRAPDNLLLVKRDSIVGVYR